MAGLQPESEPFVSSEMYDLIKIGPYELTRTLGKGTYAIVRLGVHEVTGEKVAIKILRKTFTSNPAKLQKHIHRIQREVAILKMLDHPNIVKLVDFLETPHYYAMVMEFVPGKTLYRYLRKAIQAGHEPGGVGGSGLLPSQMFRMFYQLASALECCHSFGVAHRDIKPENILVDEETGDLKLTDFGLSNLIKPDQLMDTHCGSPYYAPPEIVRGLKYKGSAADVWSLGIVLYVLSTGRLPFYDDSLSKTMTLIVEGKFHVPTHLDYHLQSLLSQMLDPSYSHRITLRQVKNHPWWLKHCTVLDLDPKGIPAATPSIAVEPPPFLPPHAPTSDEDLKLPASRTAPVFEDLSTLTLRRSVQSDPKFRRRFFSAMGDITLAPTRSPPGTPPISPEGSENSRVESKFGSRMRSLVRVLRGKICGKPSPPTQGSPSNSSTLVGLSGSRDFTKM